MNCWMKTIGVGAGLGLAITVVSSEAMSQQQGEISPDEMMERWMDYSTPGKEHEQLQHFVGEWKVNMVMWEQPGSAPSESTSESSCKMIMDGRYLIEKMKGSFDWSGTTFEFEGMGTTGFDNMQKKYVFTWIDNFSTGLMTGEGTSTDGGKTITFHSLSPNPMTGQMMKSKSVTKIIDKNKHMFVMYHPGPDGEMFKHMEATYTRK